VGYDIELDAQQGGARWNGYSCMRGKGSKCADFYGRIPGLSILLFSAGGKTVGRALMWRAEKKDGGKVDYVDRLYIPPDYAERALFLIDCAYPAAKKYGKNADGMGGAFCACDVPGETKTPYVDSFYGGKTDSSGGGLRAVWYRGGGDIDLLSADFETVQDLTNGGADICPRCGNRVNHNDGRQANNGDWFCEDCYFEVYAHCDECGDEILIEDARRGADDCDYCDYCFDKKFYECDACGEIINKEDAMYPIECGEPVCQKCCENNYAQCDECRVTHVKSGLTAYTHADGLVQDLCEYCVEQAEKDKWAAIRETAGQEIMLKWDSAAGKCVPVAGGIK
jgi:hypothetical protein